MKNYQNFTVTRKKFLHNIRPNCMRKKSFLDFPLDFSVRSSVVRDFANMGMKQTWTPKKCKSAKAQHEHLKCVSQSCNRLENPHP